MSESTQVAAPKPLVISYRPLGESSEITLTVDRVRQFLCIPTKSGKKPTDADTVRYIMLCKARELNPWAGDAYLVGYDSKDGPTFSLITAHQALLKRAEACPTFDGMESGVIVKIKDQPEPTFREGDLVLDGEALVGGWAAVYRRDRSHKFYDSLNLKTFNTGRSRWAKDPAGMIVKVAEASCLRKSFPTQIGGLYTSEEMDHVHDAPKPAIGIAAGTTISDVPSKVLDQFAKPRTVETATRPTQASDQQAHDRAMIDQGKANMEAMLATLPKPENGTGNPPSGTVTPEEAREMTEEIKREIRQTKDTVLLGQIVMAAEDNPSLTAELRLEIMDVADAQADRMREAVESGK